MNFDRYQTESRKTAIYPSAGANLTYPVLGLCGEAGEVAEKYKKILRDKNGTIDARDREALVKELGDVLWYLAQVASELSVSLDEVATLNLAKLADRKTRAVLQGSGDDR